MAGISPKLAASIAPRVIASPVPTWRCGGGGLSANAAVQSPAGCGIRGCCIGPLNAPSQLSDVPGLGGGVPVGRTVIQSSGGRFCCGACAAYVSLIVLPENTNIPSAFARDRRYANPSRSPRQLHLVLIER